MNEVGELQLQYQKRGEGSLWSLGLKQDRTGSGMNGTGNSNVLYLVLTPRYQDLKHLSQPTLVHSFQSGIAEFL
jgi:hypothetical protein